MKAAILYETHKPLVIEDIDIPEPKDGEVLVKLVATGVCHTDLHPVKGDMPIPLPAVLGHEGAGIVEKVTPGVVGLKPGDHVVLSVMSYCGRCPFCLSGRPYLCGEAWAKIFEGLMLDGTRRLRNKSNQELNHFFCQSSFAEYAVVDQKTAVKIREDVPLTKVAVLGCGATTGFGTVLNTAKVEAGQSVAILGCGGVGLSAVMAAKLAGAGKIIAVDIVESKLKLAKQFGATHVINGAQENIVETIRQLTGFGVDYAMEFVGNLELMSQAFEAIKPGGKAIIVGSPTFGAKVSVDAVSLLSEKTLTGTAGGSLRPAIDIPRYIDLYVEGKLDLESLVSRQYSLEEVNVAFEAMEKGEVIRSVIVF